MYYFLNEGGDYFVALSELCININLFGESAVPHVDPIPASVEIIVVY